MKQKLILLTNDDGIFSLGLLSLHKELSNFGKVFCVAPGNPSSAISKALTFHKPIRFSTHTFEDGTTAYSTTGAPADNVLLSFHLLKGKPDIVVSGINYGDNSSIHSILTSGTCAAAFESAFSGVPAIAFSVDVEHDIQLIEQKGINFDYIAMISSEIVKFTLEKEWPKDLAFLNINFPTNVTKHTKIYVTSPTLCKYDNFMIEKDDPRGLPYFWLWGEMKKTFPEGSDTWAVKHKNGISITPIGLNLHEKTDQSMNLTCFIQEQVKNILT
ncbi:MAG: 5'/3'-nucleotidase SurE [Candidatus Heimdallarchaeota archaeon]|nr:5'/3'-nucleotidase SurE [Candidatus Heimdallarchaeota archaeon]